MLTKREAVLVVALALGVLTLQTSLAGGAAAQQEAPEPQGHGMMMGQAHGYGMMGSQSPRVMMGPGMMDPGVMGPGMMGPGMMDHGPGMMDPGVMGPGMMGPGMMGYGPRGHGMLSLGPRWPGNPYGTIGPRHGWPIPVPRELTVDDVRLWLDQALGWLGNARLKVGQVAEADEATITAEIVTLDDSLVQRLAVDRRNGAVRQVE